MIREGLFFTIDFQCYSKITLNVKYHKQFNLCITIRSIIGFTIELYWLATNKWFWISWTSVQSIDPYENVRALDNINYTRWHGKIFQMCIFFLHVSSFSCVIHKKKKKKKEITTTELVFNEALWLWYANDDERSQNKGIRTTCY